ncbi:MAG TPA: methionine--tRNA ligase subunit beta, partial [Vicinamibacterales bacterium]|nr:methionine--tRNA ligase subunit beta [Vicinamibacterales bacterium]
ANVERVNGILFDVAEAIRIAAVLLLPVMPASCAEILRRVGERRPASELRLDRDAAWRPDGVRGIVKAPALWPRAEEAQPAGRPAPERAGGVARAAGGQNRSGEDREHERADRGTGPFEETHVRDAPPSPHPPAPAADDGRIAIDEFMKIDLRVARVLEAEAVPKSRKLVKLRIDLGAEQRTIVAGIADAYRPEQLVGRSIVVVANLRPAKLMGIASDGMVLAASPDGAPPSLVSVDASIPPGTRVR